jgi:hypothetical protein
MAKYHVGCGITAIYAGTLNNEELGKLPKGYDCALWQPKVRE